MAKIVFDNGKTVEFDGNPTPQDIEDVAQQVGAVNSQSNSKSEIKTPGLFGTSIGENSKWMKGARVIEDTVKTGGKMMSDAIPDATTRSVPLNFMLNIPKAATELGTQLVSGQVSPEAAILHGGSKVLEEAAPYAMPSINAAGRWLGDQAENISGLKYKAPGALAATVEDPALPLRAGRTSSQAAYDAAKNESNIIRPEFKEIKKPEDVVLQTLDALDNSGITDQEALYGRKMLDQTKNKWAPEFYNAARQKLDNVAKGSFAGADAAHQQALKSEALRNIGSINKNGTTSVARNIAMGVAPPTAAIFSPAAQGTIASGIGIGSRAIQAGIESPGVMAELDALMRKKKEDKNGNR